MTRALVVDHERKTRRILQVVLEGLAVESVAAASAQQALELFAKQPFDLVLTDLQLPGMDMLELLPKLRELDADVPVIVLATYDAVQAAVDAVKLGAFDFVLKPFAVENLELRLRHALELRRMRVENPRRYELGAQVPLFEDPAQVPASAPAQVREAAYGGSALAPSPSADSYALEPAVEDVERRTILRALGAACDNKARAARLLRVSERTLWYKLKRYGL